MPTPANQIIAAALRAGDTGALEITYLSSDDPLMVVFVLDDDTQPYRIVRTVPDMEHARQALTDAPDGFLSEYLIDLTAPLSACVTQVIDDGDTVTFDDPPFAFDEDHVAFA